MSALNNLIGLQNQHFGLICDNVLNEYMKINHLIDLVATSFQDHYLHQNQVTLTRESEEEVVWN